MLDVPSRHVPARPRPFHSAANITYYHPISPNITQYHQNIRAQLEVRGSFPACPPKPRRRKRRRTTSHKFPQASTSFYKLEYFFCSPATPGQSRITQTELEPT